MALFSFEELSMYERERSAHDPINDTNVLVQSDALKNDFTCTICLDIIKRTMTSQRCMHRFCYECITKSLRLSNKECPTCRTKLISKRDLREDFVFDALIQKLFPEALEKPNDVNESQYPLKQDKNRKKNIQGGDENGKGKTKKNVEAAPEPNTRRSKRVEEKATVKTPGTGAANGRARRKTKKRQ